MTRPWLLVSAGITTAALTLAALVLAGERDPPPRHDWRPTCVDTLGEPYRAADARLLSRAVSPVLVLVGLDASGSNASALNDQLAAVQGWVDTSDPEVEIGTLLVSAASDASAVADLRLPATPRSEVETVPPCAGECRPSSLFEQSCLEQLERALEQRVIGLEDRAREQIEAAREGRRHAMADWVEKTRRAPPAPGTTLSRFWRKVADHPRVRASPTSVSVVLLSDLAETDPGARRWLKRLRSDGPCPPQSPLPRLDGIPVTLLHTVGAARNEPWRDRWRFALTCAGARVTDYRWTPSLSLTDYIGAQATQGRTNSATVLTIESSHTALAR